MDVAELPLALPTGSDEQELWIGRTAEMQQVGRLCLALAQTERTGALILGESGVGKELVARAIHQLSRRAARPFIAVNCGAIPLNLAESELFGTERGGYTDARARRGLVEQAHNGTLFLDEIGELSPGVQRTLLRFLETRQFRRLGSEHVGLADVRVLAATLRDLTAATQIGSFRQDLLFRINVFVIIIPPLRARLVDLPDLVTLTLRRLARANRLTQAPTCDAGALELLAAHPWPGNIRELRNALERALVLSDGGTITPALLPEALRHPRRADPPEPTLAATLAELRLPADGASLPDLVHLLESTLIDQAMVQARGNQSRAAQLLGLSRDQLRQRRRRGAQPSR